MLRVQSMVRSRLWNMAWQEEMGQTKADDLAVPSLPLWLWLEFLGAARQGAMTGNRASYGRANAGRPMPLQMPYSTVTTARFHILRPCSSFADDSGRWRSGR